MLWYTAGLGYMAEWTNALAWKACRGRKLPQRFESSYIRTDYLAAVKMGDRPRMSQSFPRPRPYQEIWLSGRKHLFRKQAEREYLFHRFESCSLRMETFSIIVLILLVGLVTFLVASFVIAAIMDGREQRKRERKR